MTRRVWWGLLALLFVVVPVLEIYVLIQVGQVIGAWWTVLLLIADGMLGSYLVKHQGGRAWTALRQALDEHRVPARELADGALILVGGTLLLTPGFVTDVFGLFCVLPFTRPFARRLLTALLTRKFLASPLIGMYDARGTGTRTSRRPGPDSVVQGDVVD
ncbi:MAG TPA: FxsA family protein [Nocardioidaceae bacterium]|nr:FxsA family protein [Nocardioidaceae bacterium]